MKYMCNKLVQIHSATVFPRQFPEKAATQVADVAFGADQKDRHLQRTALDDYQADDVTLLLGQYLAGLVLGILLQEGSKQLRVQTVDFFAKG